MEVLPYNDDIPKRFDIGAKTCLRNIFMHYSSGENALYKCVNKIYFIVDLDRTTIRSGGETLEKFNGFEKISKFNG